MGFALYQMTIFFFSTQFDRSIKVKSPYSFIRVCVEMTFACAHTYFIKVSPPPGFLEVFAIGSEHRIVIGTTRHTIVVVVVVVIITVSVSQVSI